MENKKSNIYKGIITTDSEDRQQKKHYTQMTKEEIDLLRNATTNAYDKLHVGIHAKEKEDFCGIQLIRKIIETGTYDIIEYNITKYGKNKVSKRVVIRSVEAFNRFASIRGGEREWRKCNICIVLDINTGIIITTYYNLDKDSHTSINIRRYNKDLKIEL